MKRWVLLPFLVVSLACEPSLVWDFTVDSIEVTGTVTLDGQPLETWVGLYEWAVWPENHVTGAASSPEDGYYRVIAYGCGPFLLGVREQHVGTIEGCGLHQLDIEIVIDTLGD